MQRQMHLIDFKIAVNVLSDYIAQKDQELLHLQHNFTSQFLQQSRTGFYDWLIRTTKSTISTLQLAYLGTKTILHDLNLDFLYSFFYKCLATLEQATSYLIQALTERINYSIDSKSPIEHVLHSSVIGVIEENKEAKQNLEEPCTNEVIQKARRAISKDLESIDYYLNLLAYQDSKVYEQYKFQCQKLLLQRQNLESIKASNASKEIYQTANMIQNSLQNTQKLFQQSYHLKYMEFKNFLSTIQEPQEVINMFKTDIQANAKDKFLEAMVKTVNKYISKAKNNERRHQATISTQTEEVKNRIQDKWQSLLMAEKKHNEKLTQEIEKIKRNSGNSSAIQRFSDAQRKLEREETLRKDLQNKYAILEDLYNEKCYQILRMSNQSKKTAKTQPLQKSQTTAGTQTFSQYHQSKFPTESQAQTDGDFYYYYLQKNKIKEMQHKIDQLQKIVNHKQYIIKEMEAVKTFRDKFKSKKEIYSFVIKPSQQTPVAKSLHYLQEEGEQDIFEHKDSPKMNSIEANSLKKEVTFHELNDQEAQHIIGHRKKLKKKTEGDKYRPYLTFNAKIDNFDSQKDFIASKSEFQHPHQISLRSILKVGVGSPTTKCDQSVQTQEQSRIFKPQSLVAQNAKELPNQPQSKQKAGNQKDLGKQNIELNENSKQPIANSSEKYAVTMQRQKNSQYNFVTRNKSSLIEDKDKKPEPKNPSESTLLTVHRKSQTMSAFKRKSEFSKNKNFLKTTKPSDRVQTQNNEVLHVNNSLNLNFSSFTPMNCTISKISMNQGMRMQMNRAKKLKR